MRVWDTELIDAMVRAFDANRDKHGTRETLMAVVQAADDHRAALSRLSVDPLQLDLDRSAQPADFDREAAGGEEAGDRDGVGADLVGTIAPDAHPGDQEHGSAPSEGSQSRYTASDPNQQISCHTNLSRQEASGEVREALAIARRAADASDHMLGELLATIHRDGGHYVEGALRVWEEIAEQQRAIGRPLLSRDEREAGIPSTAPDELRAEGDVVGEVVKSAKRHVSRVQCDFLGRMGEALCYYQAAFDDYPDGELPDAVKLDADEQIAELASLALAQLAMLRFPRNPQFALARPDRMAEMEGLRALSEKAKLPELSADTHHARDYAGRVHGFIRVAGELAPVGAVILSAEGCDQEQGRARLSFIVACVNHVRAALSGSEGGR